MKIKTQILLYVLLCAIGAAAQKHKNYTPICTVNTNGWKKIPTIPVDMRCIVAYIQRQPGCVKTYNLDANFNIWLYTSLKKNKTTCKHKHTFDNYDLSMYNLISILYGNGDACDMTLDYSLYNDGSSRPALIVNVLIPESRCKMNSTISRTFLVLKKDCPIKPKVCLINHLIGLTDNEK